MEEYEIYDVDESVWNSLSDEEKDDIRVNTSLTSKDTARMTEEQRRCRDEALERFFDSDEFLEQPWVKKLKKYFDYEENRERTVVVDPIRYGKLLLAYKAVLELLQKSYSDAPVEIIEFKQRRSAVIRVTSAALDFGKNVKDILQYIIEDSDGISISGGIHGDFILEFDFKNVFVENR